MTAPGAPRPGPGSHAGRVGRPGAPMGGPAGGRRPGGGFGHGMMALPAEKSKDFRGSFLRLLRRVRPELPLVGLVLILGIVSVVLAILGPKILGNATDIIFSGAIGKGLPAGVPKDQIVAGLRARGQDRLADMLAAMDLTPGRGIDFDALGRVLILLIGVYLVSAVFSWGQAWVMAGVTQRTIYRLRRDADEKLGRLPLGYFDENPRGDILSRITNDIDNVGQSLQQSLTQLMTSLLTVIGVLLMMLTISPPLALISLLAVPLSLVGTVLIASRSQRLFAAQWASTGRLNGHVEEMHTGHDIVTVFGRQEAAIATFDAENATLYDSSYRAQFMAGIIQPVMNVVGNLNYVAIAVIGGLRVASGQMSLGDVLAFVQYSRQFTFPIIQVAGSLNVLQSAIASAERVFELLDATEEQPDTASPRRLEAPAGEVRFEDVSFRYLPEVPLIDGLDLVAASGQTVAIVGPTGAGKTTLVNLLMRFYEIDGGVIRLDGIDIRDLTRGDLRQSFGMVLQDTWLVHGTIGENIAYGRDGATEAEIVAAAEAAHVDHFVRTLPTGYDTVIDDDATNLSQGEKQLLTIARAFLADPPILILDEATSSVDSRTEILVQRAMARLLHGRTAFVIAHRLSTIRNADRILVMEGGAIVEQGNHEALLAKGGAYARLYRSQFEEALADAS